MNWLDRLKQHYYQWQSQRCEEDYTANMLKGYPEVALVYLASSGEYADKAQAIAQKYAKLEEAKEEDRVVFLGGGYSIVPTKAVEHYGEEFFQKINQIGAYSVFDETNHNPDTAMYYDKYPDIQEELAAINKKVFNAGN